jgi:AcrR family transcriptional regulator
VALYLWYRDDALLSLRPDSGVERVQKMLDIRTGRVQAHTEHVQTMTQSKSESTENKIFEAALASFREQGFEAATMRGIAERAGVALGASYYYYASKDAIVMDFYRRSCDEMQDGIRQALEGTKSLERSLRSLIEVKLTYFGPNREVLRALLRNGADPRHALSPFSAETKDIREVDISWFDYAVRQSGARVPRDLSPRLPAVLWFFQMGVILFWVTDDSPRQCRTEKLLAIACKVVTSLIRLSSLPLMRALRKPVLELIEIAAGGSCE